MNKQEAVKGIEDEKILGFTTYEDESYNEGLITALSYVEAIEVPEKPVVPQFVADYIDSEQHSCSTLSEALDNMDDEKRILDWFYVNPETFAKAWLFGYEVKKEKLYTVEIPNPNGDGYSKTFLGKFKDDKVELCKWSCYTSIEFADNWKQEEYAQLTETEIKEDFEWAWQFAEEVEE